MNNILIPNEDQCLIILNKYNILPNILEHSQKVKMVSLSLADNLKDKSAINRELVIAAALLHDIAKTICLGKKDYSHDFLGGKILRDMGFIDIALIVESHVLMPDFNPDGAVEEREIVHYADKRVMHDKVVSINERINDIIKRYGKNIRDENYIKKNRKIIDGMELKIQRHLNIDIDTAIKDL